MFGPAWSTLTGMSTFSPMRTVFVATAGGSSYSSDTSSKVQVIGSTATGTGRVQVLLPGEEADPGSATGKTYGVRDADVGYRLAVVVTATNASGKATAKSALTDFVEPKPGVPAYG